MTPDIAGIDGFGLVWFGLVWLGLVLAWLGLADYFVVCGCLIFFFFCVTK